MLTIDIGKNAKVVSTYTNPITGEEMTLTVREWTIEELLTLNSVLGQNMRDERDNYNNLLSEVRKHDVNWHDIQVKNEKYQKFKELDQSIKDSSAQSELFGIMADGIHGAIRYYVVQRFNDIIPAVMKKYAGKKCGPKTYEKFRHDIEEAMGIPGMHVYFQHSHVDFYGGGVGNDCCAYELDDLTDNDNKFKETYRVHKVKDSFDGLYPDNWMAWATMVSEANADIQSAFDEFISKQDKLVDLLKIGDTGMKRVYKYDMKEVR